MSGQLCLKWNNHSVAFNKLLNNIYLEDVYSDATILCHGKFYPVHRFVLSTCSEYFEEMFRQCIRLNNKQPFIIVKDIHPEQMEALLNYMYKGEVNVPQEMLPELIKAAEAFKIRGLAVPDEEPAPKSRKRANVSSPTSIPKKSKRHEDKSCSNLSDTSSDIKSSRCDIDDSSSSQLFQHSSKSTDGMAGSPTQPFIDKIKKEHIDEQETIAIVDVDNIDSPIKQEQHNYETFVEDGASAELFDFDGSNDQFDASSDQFDASTCQFDEQQESSSWSNTQLYEAGDSNENDDGTQRSREPRLSSSFAAVDEDESMNDQEKHYSTCPFPPCSYKSRYNHMVERHVRTHTGEKPFQCHLCSYKSALDGNVKRHIKTVHSNDKPFQCSMCCYNTAFNSSLKRHISNLHRGQLFKEP